MPSTAINASKPAIRPRGGDDEVAAGAHGWHTCAPRSARAAMYTQDAPRWPMAMPRAAQRAAWASRSARQAEPFLRARPLAGALCPVGQAAPCLRARTPRRWSFRTARRILRPPAFHNHTSCISSRSPHASVEDNCRTPARPPLSREWIVYLQRHDGLASCTVVPNGAAPSSGQVKAPIPRSRRPISGRSCGAASRHAE